MPRTFKVGLVQMRCRRDPDDEPRAGPSSRVAEAAAAGRRGRLPAGAVPLAVLLPERGPRAVRPGRADPGPDDRGAARRSRSETKRRGRRRRSSSGARPGVYHNTRRRHRRRRRSCSACTARCTSPTIRSTTRSSTSRRATSASRPSTRRFGRIGTLVCWDQWYPGGGAADGAAGAPRSSSTRRRSAGIPREKAEYGAAQRDAWETMQRAHAIANGVYVGGREPRRPRRSRRTARARVLGRVVRRRPVRRRHRRGVARPRRDPDRRRATSTRMEDVRRNWPFLRDRRIDAYAGIDRRFLD